MELYAFGSNGSGQLGTGHARDICTPAKCIFDIDTTSEPLLFRGIAASGSSTLVLLENGQIYRAGAYFGLRSLQINAEESYSTSFQLLPLTRDRRAKFCSATWEAVIVATEGNEVFVWGRGSKGELGLGMKTSDAYEPFLLSSFPPKGCTIVDLKSNVSHTVVVLSNGEVYGWGNGRKGQLGESMGIIWSPRRIDGLGFKVKRAACGRDFTILVGEPCCSELQILGSDKWGAISMAPSKLNDWHNIGASWGSIFVQTQAGAIISWGRNDQGQLASPNPLGILSMAIGSEHGIARMEHSRVICWGWGEHGNCGVVSEETGDPLGQWINIDKNLVANGEVAGVGAGCATSFFWVNRR